MYKPITIIVQQLSIERYFVICLKNVTPLCPANQIYKQVVLYNLVSSVFPHFEVHIFSQCTYTGCFPSSHFLFLSLYLSCEPYRLLSFSRRQ